MPRRIAGPCPVPGCPGKAGLCKAHRRQREQARGTRQQRGYARAHDRLRAEWQRRLDMGEVVWCWRCITNGVRTRIDPADWHLGHDDADRTIYRGPECPPCNQATAGRRGGG